MPRVNIVAEGQTEEAFVNELLGPALYGLGVYPTARLAGKPKRRGGVTSYGSVKRDVLLALKQDRNAYCSTMLDYYRLPRDFPGLAMRSDHPAQEKARIIERALHDDIAKALGDSFDPNYFIPYIQMHEYEGLLFSDPLRLAEGIYRPDLARAFAEIRRAFSTPEDIDDGDDTAPSKRILDLCRGYAKPIHGVLAAIEIGIVAIRRECPHFDQWVTELEALGQEQRQA